ncbi:Serine/arginine-rich splicing factor 6 [Madurella mycetomatis]|uniref:Serine/arginine-rich splicing factor 6 n=1 Tax=Madurella mycetomatis TaxID=100816 RepID=A0A175W5Q8_9PEZI|nr:Serine/arginine-rich splicing factor 6 [Madurella mycetomatis]
MSGGSKLSRNQQHSRRLITVTVGPGSETGLYYILVANLSHNTTWKELKAFASQACDVDHTEVYTPTSGFVRVRGLANFEKAFNHLNGNILEYRSLQADARNKTQSTVVKLPTTDYHAVRILRGDMGRVYSEPESRIVQTEPLPQSAAGGMSGPCPVYHRVPNPEFNTSLQVRMQWDYAAFPPYLLVEGYQTAMAPASAVYRAEADLPHDLSQLTIGRHLFIPQSMEYPAVTSPTAGTAQYPYGMSVSCYPSGANYAVAAQDYVECTGAQSPDKISISQAYNSGYADAWPLTTQSGQVIHYDRERAGVVMIEQRKIIIINLERDGLSAAGVVGLVAEYAGIGLTGPSCQIEWIDLPINKDGRARGTALVTFSTAELAKATIAALDGREVGGRKLVVRMAEGVSGSGFGSRPGRLGRPAANGRNVAGVGTGQGKAPSRSLSHVDGLKRGLVLMPGAAPASVPAPAPALTSPPVGSGSLKKKEDPPVIANGSGGRWKKEDPPVVVNGSSMQDQGSQLQGPRN